MARCAGSALPQTCQNDAIIIRSTIMHDEGLLGITHMWLWLRYVLSRSRYMYRTLIYFHDLHECAMMSVHFHACLQADIIDDNESLKSRALRHVLSKDRSNVSKVALFLPQSKGHLSQGWRA